MEESNYFGFPAKDNYNGQFSTDVSADGPKVTAEQYARYNPAQVVNAQEECKYVTE